MTSGNPLGFFLVWNYILLYLVGVALSLGASFFLPLRREEEKMTVAIILATVGMLLLGATPLFLYLVTIIPRPVDAGGIILSGDLVGIACLWQAKKLFWD